MWLSWVPFLTFFFFFCLGNRANWNGKFDFWYENVEAEQDFKKESVTFAY